MAEQLTKDQSKAVHYRGGKLLVSAAAGSGKTKVLVDRLLTYLTDVNNPANLDEFLIITYTKAAASELRGKIAAKLTERIAQEPESRLQQQMQRLFLTKISTVHGFCGDIIREYVHRTTLPADFRVADENECRELRDQVLADLLDESYAGMDQNPDFLAFVDTQGVGRNDSVVPELILKIYDSAKCHLDPQGWLNQCLEAAKMGEITDAAQTIWGEYLMEQLKENLDCHIQVLETCVSQAQKAEGLDKVADNIEKLLRQLRHLRESETWDQVLERKNILFDRFPTVRKGDTLLKDKIKAARDACNKDLEKLLRAFEDRSEKVIRDLEQSAAGTRGIIDLVRRFDAEFSKAKRGRKIVDFSDLEHVTLDILLGKDRSGPTTAAKEIAMRFREIMVDEYQDSNAVQDKIFEILTMHRNNCFMVGDVKQSIYQFRLADPGIFLDKYDKYSLVTQEDIDQKRSYEPGGKVLLSQNFRSGQEVIDAVNDVFRKCMSPAVGGLHYTEQEALVVRPNCTQLENAIEFYALQADQNTYEDEAAFVANRIRQMLDEGTPIRDGDGFRSVKPDDIVILLRSPNSSGGYFQQKLEALGIRCASGGGNDLLQTKEVATLRCLLETIYNPRQDIPLLSVLASPIFGFTADDLAAIRAKNKDGYFYEALMADDSEKTESFRSAFSQLREEARMNSLTQLLESCFQKTHMDSIYGAMAGGDARRANLQTFFQLAVDYEMGTHRSLSQFLDHLKALEDKGLLSTGSSAAGCVTIMSIHKSKGLEFPVVFLCGLSRQFNRESLKGQILSDKKLGLGLSVVDTQRRLRYPTIAKKAIAAKMAAESLSEEMRVLYVAMTRPRDRLVMTFVHQNLDNKLKNMIHRMDFDNGNLICRNAGCPGDWVLLTALSKTEAGALYNRVGLEGNTSFCNTQWVIRDGNLQTVNTVKTAQPRQADAMPEDVPRRLREALDFRYSYPEATQTPSKQTATGLKGRGLDEEAAQDALDKETQVVRSWRVPSFISKQRSGTFYGNAIHAAMQYIRYDSCNNIFQVEQEIQRLMQEHFLSQEQGAMVSRHQIAAFFLTESGKQLRRGVEHIREFKFSILDDAEKYGGPVGEKVMLQGVVDCAIIEPDGITIIDFKSDKVEDQARELVARYRPQLETYSYALSQIYNMPIKSRKLYFFEKDLLVEV